jgi:hypothetical protein
MTIKHLYPAVEPSLNLDFANSKKLDSRITFTRGSTATYTDESGIIRTAAANEARFDHDSDGNSLGLLIEESRTNYFKNSVDLGSSLTSGNAVLTSNQTTAPDNTVTATKIAETLTNVAQSKALTFNEWATPNGSTGTANIPLVLTGFVKAGTLNRCAIAMGNGGAIISVNVNLTDGTYTQYKWSGVSEDEITVVPFPNGWYKVIIQAKINYQYNRIHVFATTNDTAPTNHAVAAYQGNGDYFYAWGFQWEVGSFPTSYIPTSGSTATRSADVASITGTNFSSWYNQSEGTLYQDCTTRVPATALNPDVGVGAIMTASGNVQLGFYQVLNTSNLNAVVYQTATAYSANLSLSGAWTQNVPSKAALAYKQNSFAASADGATPQTDSSGIVPIPNALDIGQLSTFPSNHIGAGTFARLTYYPVRLPDATLQALTL